jgi:outer membrane protein assembly factor BamB
MFRRLGLAILAAVLVVHPSVSGRAGVPRPGIDWPAFRGIQAAGVADGHPTLTTWDVPKNQGVRWKTPIEGLGHSSPVIWGDRLCITTAISGRADAGIRTGLYGDIASVQDDTPHTWKLLCLNKKTGEPIFSRTMASGLPKIKRHTKSTHANSTLATDGEYLVATLGSEGLFAYDMNGTLKWKKDLGVLDSGYYMAPDAQWEFGSSPVIHDGVILLQADVQKGSFLGAFDLKTGREIWRLKGGGDIPVPTPVVGFGLVFLTNAHGPMAPIYAVRETAAGDVSLQSGETSNAHVAWSTTRDGAYMITPVLYRDLLYVAKNNGTFMAFNAKSGERLYQNRLGTGTTGFTASLVAADGKVFAASEDGDVYVVKAGPVFEVLATNPIGDFAMATPAISEGVLYVRTGKGVVAIGK